MASRAFITVVTYPKAGKYARKNVFTKAMQASQLVDLDYMTQHIQKMNLFPGAEKVEVYEAEDVKMPTRVVDMIQRPPKSIRGNRITTPRPSAPNRADSVAPVGPVVEAQIEALQGENRMRDPDLNPAELQADPPRKE